MVVVEWTQTDVVATTLGELDVFRDDIDDIDRFADTVDRLFWNTRQAGRPSLGRDESGGRGD